MLRTRSALTAFVMLVAVGCDGEENMEHGVGTGTGLSLSCVESGPECTPPATIQGQVAATSLYLCNYWESSHSFQVQFQESGSADGVLVQIADFHGDGTYTTNAEGTTNVTVTADEAGGDAAGVEGSIPEHPCTIVAATNLEDITVSEGGNANILNVELDVSCAGLGGGAVCPWECTLTPSSFHLSVQGCLASE